MMIVKQKNFKSVLLAVFAILFCAISFMGFYGSAFAEGQTADDFDEFYEDFMGMVNRYDNPQDQEIATLSLDEDESRGYQTRLIVTTNEKIDDYGAVASCHYKNHFYFQYENYDDTDSAYEYFSALPNVSVMYDYETCVEGETVEADANGVYNSWGWNANTDYLGANAYLTTLQETISMEDLRGQIVAVVDTGLYAQHSLFSERVVKEYARNFVAGGNANDYSDAAGHGTHVSGTIAEITPSAVKILPLRVLGADGRGLISYITAAIDYAIDKKAEIESRYNCDFKLMNMSLGITADAANARSQALGEVSANALSPYDLSAWVEEAYSAGILSIVSAGNTQPKGVLIEYAPANIDHAIVVSALARTWITKSPLIYDESYSNYGPTVDFAAPGTNITSAGRSGVDSLDVMSGTSMAAPHVTACVALVYLHPSYNKCSFEELNRLLRENADRTQIYDNKYALKSGQERNDYYGYGIINIKKFGMMIEGKVNFSGEQFPTGNSVTVKLSTTITTGAGETREIRYTTDEGAEAVSSSDTLYNDDVGIVVNKSTKITAVAFVKKGNVIVKRSETATQVFYIGNQDLESRFTISTAGVITQYTGEELTKLIIPSKIKNVTVKAVSKAFNNSPVQELILPSSLTTINSNAFDANIKLQSITCKSASVDVGKYAFQKCTSLTQVNIPNIKTIDDLAFAYSTALDKLEFMNVTRIGKNVFSASSLKEVIIGKNVTEIGTNTQMNLEIVYGYSGTVAEKFADDMHAQFCDLNLRILEDLPTKKVIREGNTLSFRLICAGYEVKPTVMADGGTASVEQTGDYSRLVVNVTITNLKTNNYNIRVKLVDNKGYGTTIESGSMQVIVVPQSAQSSRLTFNSAECDVYVDGELVENGHELFVGQTYRITFAVHDGYTISGIRINDRQISAGTYHDIKIENQNDTRVSINTIAEDILQVNFISEHGTVIIDGQPCQDEAIPVERNASLSFSISSEQGWAVKRVLVDGVELVGVDGVYTIEDITTKKVVEIRYEEASYSIEIVFVNSCGTYTVSGGGNLSNVEHGSNREISIVATGGYVIDFVSVNGEIIKVTNGRFVISNIDSDKEVVVSFKPQKISIFKKDHSIILYYFIVLVVLFVTFVVANISVKILRKKQKKD